MESMHQIASTMNCRRLRSLFPAAAFILIPFLSCVNCSILTPPDQQQPGERSLISSQFSVDPYADVDKLPLILDGTLQLAGCDIPSAPLSSVTDLECYYCDLGADTWAAQQDNPHLLPSFRDMLGESIHCSDHAYLYSLKEIVDKAKSYDVAKNIPAGKVKGVIASQPSSGSSVLMHAIIVGEGSKSRTYADHPAIIALLDACSNLDENLCDFEDHVSAMVDLIYMLTRHNSDIYIKLNPSSSANIKVLREALHGQDVKWAYVHRDADEVLTKATERKRHGCLKNRNNPSNGLLAYVQEMEYADLKGLTDEEVCSAFFAYNHKTAVDEFSSDNPSTVFMDYESSIKEKNQLINHLQKFFKIDVSAKVKDQMLIKSQNRGSRKYDIWTDEPQLRVVKDSVRSANEKFLSKVKIG